MSLRITYAEEERALSPARASIGQALPLSGGGGDRGRQQAHSVCVGDWYLRRKRGLSYQGSGALLHGPCFILSSVGDSQG